MPIPPMSKPMPWALERSPDLRGIIAKLDRAEHHIDQLKGAVDACLGSEKDRRIPNDDPETTKAFVGLHEGRIADLNLSIVTGEVLYQIRSSLDHIVCALIRKAGNTPSTKSQWPIFSHQPTKKDDIKRYEAQVQGIDDQGILSVIEFFQPYSRGKRTNLHPDTARLIDRSVAMLPILKTLSNFDKHQAVALHVVSVAKRKMIAIRDDRGLEVHIHGNDGDDLAQGLPVAHEKRYLTTYVAFQKFGDSSRIPVVDGLHNLLAAPYPIVGELWGRL